MNLNYEEILKPGRNPPEEINVIIEIPKGSNVKYELDKDSGLIFVDRMLLSAMYYPCNYGFIPQTKEDDEDPVDVLVLGNVPIVPKAVIRARPIGVLLTEDEKGNDSKIIATALNDVDPSFSQVSDVEDIPDHVRNQITHFFEHYKELEEGKYVRIVGWKDREFAKEKIVKAMNIYRGLGQSN